MTMQCLLSILLMTTTVTGATRSMRIENPSDRGIVHYSDIFGVRREKRSPLFVAQLAHEGTKAVRYLLNGASGVPTNRNLYYRSYVKNGGYEQALRDFGAVRPTAIRKYFEGQKSGNVGIVGDRKIYIQKNGETGNPTLTILKPSYNGAMEVDKITYLD